MKPQGQRLDGDNLQDVLDAGENAAQVGRQQFFTPPEIAAALMTPLPSAQETFVDLTMGAGTLLAASGATDLFGVDIDSRLARKPIGNRESTIENRESKWHPVCADLTRFYPLLQEIDWKFDLCGLNPPFSVKWHRQNLIGLVDSGCDAVRETFAEARKPTIDSTLATMLIALDRMTERGEGFILVSDSAAKRLSELPIWRHVWLHLRIPHGEHIFKNCRPFGVSVLYFARSHWQRDLPSEPMACHALPEIYQEGSNSIAQVIAHQLAGPRSLRSTIRRGISLHNAHHFHELTEPLWRAAQTEWKRLARSTEIATRNPDYNIWLRQDGTIGRHLTPFQAYSGRIPGEKAAALDRLRGQTPMSLVVQRATRLALLDAIGTNAPDGAHPWRVDPALVAAVRKAVAEYHAERAPFYPLSDIQRLGYLDEENTIVCKRNGLDGFEKGGRYELSSETIDIERDESRLNLLGKTEQVTLHGKELAFYIADKTGRRHKFSPVSLTSEAEGTKERSQDAIYHDLAALVRHFEIPQVADVAQVFPDRYQAFVDQIRQIEQRVNAQQRAA